MADDKKPAASKNELSVFAGELLANPAPLELSFNECSYNCSYCFAKLNERPPQRGVVARPTLKHIESVFRHGGNPRSLADKLLLAKHPIVFSNSVDPSSFRNLESTRQTLPVLQALGVPVILQTRGTRKPEDFGEILEMLPAGSVVYMSITSFDPVVLRDVEKGCPRCEDRLVMMAMAKEAGFATVAALNPLDADWVGDVPSFFSRIDEIAGVDGVDGCWVELLHLRAKQKQVMLGKAKGVLPVIAEQAVARASARPFLADAFFVDDVWAEIDGRSWRRYSYNLQWKNKGRADLFDLWPNPFLHHHQFVAACNEVSADAGGAPVAVTFETFCSWVDPVGEILDWEISRGDAWYFINGKQNAGDENRKGLLKTVSLRECLRFVWDRPDMGLQAIYGAYGLRGLAETLAGDDGAPVALANFRLREDDQTALAVFAPQERLPSGEARYATDKHDRWRLVEEVEPDFVMLPPLTLEDVEAASRAS